MPAHLPHALDAGSRATAQYFHPDEVRSYIAVQQGLRTMRGFVEPSAEESSPRRYLPVNWRTAYIPSLRDELRLLARLLKCRLFGTKFSTPFTSNEPDSRKR